VVTRRLPTPEEARRHLDEREATKALPVTAKLALLAEKVERQSHAPDE